MAWAYRAGGDISGSAVVNDAGQVLFGARDTHLYCLSPGGAEAWVTSLGEYGTSIYFTAPALDDQGNIYITTNRKLVKVDSAGHVVWWYPDHNSLSISHSPVIGQDGRVYFACYSESLYALLPNGNLDWAFPLGADVNSSPAVGHDGRVYVATTRGTGSWKLWAFTPDGDTVWTLPLAGEADFASPAVGPDSVVYVGADRYLYAVNHDGTVRWRDSLYAAITSCPAVGDDSTIYVTAGAYLYNVSADSGIRWRKNLGGSNYSSPAVDAEGNVYVGSASSRFYVVANDSTVLWSQSTPGGVWASPAIGPDGDVYFGCKDGSFMALQGPGAGVRAGELRTARTLRLWPNPSDGLVRLQTSVSSSDAVRVFDITGNEVGLHRSGDVLDLRSLPAGTYFVEVAGSAANGRRGKVVIE